MTALDLRCGGGVRASILIAAVWVLVFFTVLGTAFYGLFSGRFSLVSRLKDRLPAEQAAYSAVELVKFELAADKEYADSLKELAGRRSKDLGLAAFDCTVGDEQAKLNINYAEAVMLARLPEMTMDTAGAIVAWKNRPFESIEELRLVEGVGDEVYAAIKDFLTVYGERSVNINTASEEVLRALGMDPGLIEKIVRFRQGEDQQAATPDDNLFSDRGTILADLARSAALTVREQAQLTNLSGLGWLGVSSEYCRLEVSVRVSGRPAGSYRIILGNQGIARWQEGFDL